MSNLISAEQVRADFAKVFGVEADHTFFSPGRINLIGEHTDYNGGHVFPAAISLGTYGAARKRDDQLLSLIHISEPTRRRGISYAVFCLKKKKNK